MLDDVPSTENKVVMKTKQKILCLHGVYVLVIRKDNKQLKIFLI